MNELLPYQRGIRASIHEMAPGKLYRAFVALPRGLGDPERPTEQRVVFFEAPHADPNPIGRLIDLLSTVWGVEAQEFHERGLIESVKSGIDLLRESAAPAAHAEQALFESGSGGELFGVGEARIHYCRSTDVDVFVSPPRAKRIRELLDDIEDQYAYEQLKAERQARG